MALEKLWRDLLFRQVSNQSNNLAYGDKHGGADSSLDSDTTLVETGKNELKTIGEVEAGMPGAGEGSHAETQSRGDAESAEATAELKQKSGVFNSALNVLKGIAQKAGSLKDNFYKSVNKQFGAGHSFDFGKPVGYPTSRII